MLAAAENGPVALQHVDEHPIVLAGERLIAELQRRATLGSLPGFVKGSLVARLRSRKAVQTSCLSPTRSWDFHPVLPMSNGSSQSSSGVWTA
jgi:hypothetical protein